MAMSSVRALINQLTGRRKYTTEIALVNGTHKNNNQHPSILHFSFNKAATQYVKSILIHCAVKNGMVPVRMHEYAFNSNFPYLSSLSHRKMNQYKHVFKYSGYLYTVFGGMVEGIPGLDKYKIVLMSRDPRDILVSEYYSIAFSHPAPLISGNKNESFRNRKRRAASSSIDEYVMSESNKLLENYLRYENLLLERYDHVYITTYEQMISDFDTWLRKLASYCELNLTGRLIKTLAARHSSLKPRVENVYQHRRKGKPGDYKLKLRPETIDRLNRDLEPMLSRFNYL